MNTNTNNLLNELQQALCNGELTNFDIHKLLATQRQIAVIWGVEDVIGECPELNEEQAWSVLLEIDHTHNACIGINWDVISVTADELFPEPETTPETTTQPSTI